MNVLGQAMLLLSGYNLRQEPQTPNSEFWPDPSVQAEVYLQNNCQIQASDTAAPNQLAFNEQLPRSGASSAFGWCAAMQWELPRCSSGDPKGILAYAFSLMTQMCSRFSCGCPPDIDLLIMAVLCLGRQPQSKCHFPHFRPMISPQASSGRLAL